jgi:quinol monooxygenase YgiN
MAGVEGELTIVTLRFDAVDPVALQPLLAKYVVVTRQADGCRNVDWCASATTPGRFLVIEKWVQPERAHAHLDAVETVELAVGCRGLLRSAPAIEVFHGISAHDLF